MIAIFKRDKKLLPDGCWMAVYCSNPGIVWLIFLCVQSKIRLSVYFVSVICNLIYYADRGTGTYDAQFCRGTSQ